jgi:hypothetical protein
VFGTIFGMVLTDAYLAYRYENIDGFPGIEMLSFHEFLQKIAHKLIFNDFVMQRSTRNTLDNEDDEYHVENVSTFFCMEYHTTNWSM